MKAGREVQGLISRNVTINGRRTSLRLEQEMWEGLNEIARREAVTLNDIVARLDRRRAPEASLTSDVRVFVLGYFRSAATERGHANAGHGVIYDPGTPPGGKRPSPRGSGAGAGAGATTKSNADSETESRAA